MWLVFEIVAVTLWLNKDNLFYLLNFSYIGSAIALGLLLFQLNYRHARRIGFIRYITFTASLVFVGALFLCHVENIEQIMFWAFLVGNILSAYGCTLKFGSHLYVANRIIESGGRVERIACSVFACIVVHVLIAYELNTNSISVGKLYVAPLSTFCRYCACRNSKKGY